MHRLGHRRTNTGDTLATDSQLAETIVESVGLSHVCLLGESGNDCDKRPGGVLTFSAVYTIDENAAVVYVVYSSVTAGASPRAGGGFEGVFDLVRRDHSWKIASRRTVAAPTKPD